MIIHRNNKENVAAWSARTSGTENPPDVPGDICQRPALYKPVPVLSHTTVYNAIILHSKDSTLQVALAADLTLKQSHHHMYCSSCS
jgi:hypothetical protein